MCDNILDIKLAKNPMMHNRNKHIDVRFYFLRDLTNEGTVKTMFCSIHDQVVDVR